MPTFYENTPAWTTHQSSQNTHAAEHRLKNLIPTIIIMAQQAVRGALTALNHISSQEKSATQYLSVVNSLLGSASEATILTYKQQLTRLQLGVLQLTPEWFDIAEVLPEAGEGTMAYIRTSDHAAFSRGEKKAYISLSWRHCGKAHPEDIASTILHELTHLLFDTKDHYYSTYVPVPSLNNAVMLEQQIKFSQRDPKKAIQNAETIARLTVLLHYISSDNPRHQKLCELYYKSSSQAVLAYHRLEDFPRVSSPEMQKRGNNLRTVRGHIVI